MTSLEIVNSHIKSIVDYLDNPQVKEDIDCLDILCVGVSYKELEQIKQDLEVLEIINKKKVNVHLVIMSLNNCFGNVEEALKYHNDYKGGFYDEYLTLEELLKLKKWLETNKVGDSHD